MVLPVIWVGGLAVIWVGGLAVIWVGDLSPLHACGVLKKPRFAKTRCNLETVSNLLEKIPYERSDKSVLPELAYPSKQVKEIQRNTCQAPTLNYCYIYKNIKATR